MRNFSHVFFSRRNDELPALSFVEISAMFHFAMKCRPCVIQDDRDDVWSDWDSRVTGRDVHLLCPVRPVRILPLVPDRSEGKLGQQRHHQSSR